jgi:hypothetical protein
MSEVSEWVIVVKSGLGTTEIEVERYSREWTAAKFAGLEKKYLQTGRV